MQKTSEWLLSFNTDYQKQINALISEKKTRVVGAQTVSITGGKGGVGKTSVSLKFALELSKQGFKTLLIDCDYNLANTAIKMGLPIDNSFYKLVTAENNFEDCLHKDGNFHLLSSCNGSIDLFDSNFRLEELVVDIINAHQSEYDFILLDCPAGLQRESLILNAYCDQRIFVVTPDKSSITDSYSLMKVLGAKFGIKENHLLVNQYVSKKQFGKVIRTLSETVENFLGCRTHILGGLPRVEVIQSRFDTFFLKETQNELHKKFLKVVSRYTDQLSRSQLDVTKASTNALLEQEVH